jgi:hypothetical protein
MTANRCRLCTLLWAFSLRVLSGCAAEALGPSEASSEAFELVDQNLKARQCRRDTDCPQPGAPCKLCSDGSTACPDVSCVARHCVYSFPECPAYQPCANKACGDTCQLCDPNDSTCVETAVVKYCQDDLSCDPTPPPCIDPCAIVRCAAGSHCDGGACIKDVFCGGIAGIPCPGFGQCVDDPSDSCDPKNGGADCGGLCECGPQTVFCIQGSHFDPSPSVCSCVPDTVGGETCGGKSCGAGEFCCNASCGICAPKGGACIQIACSATE